PHAPRSRDAATFRQASIRLARIARHLRADGRIRIRSNVLTMNVIHIVGRIGRTPLLLILGLLLSLRSLGAGAMRYTILRERGAGDHGYQRHSREQFDHSIFS